MLAAAVAGSPLALFSSFTSMASLTSSTVRRRLKGREREGRVNVLQLACAAPISSAPASWSWGTREKRYQTAEPSRWSGMELEEHLGARLEESQAHPVYSAFFFIDIL
jgi:hypothetical protein